jgi:hypothetical protein
MAGDGKILNLSSKTLWVVETDTGTAIAHLLAPNWRSPPDLDADGVRARDLGVTISNHDSWWKFRLIEVEVVDDGLNLRIRRCVAPACYDVGPGEFGDVTYNSDPGWGEEISPLELKDAGQRQFHGSAALAEHPRVTKAKQLLAAGATYPRGCSDFVAAVLEISWENANALMGDNPTNGGVNGSYPGLMPGDVAGWKNPTGHGHVAIYVGEAGTKFIDVRDENQAARALMYGYGDQQVYKSSRF